MNGIIKNSPPHRRAWLRGLNRSAVVAIWLVVLAAVLFYGPVLFFLFKR